jgi:predicted GNAT family N-acyltransferase
MITNEWILGNGDLSAPLAVRRAVFAAEYEAGALPGPDELDAQAMHLVLYDDGAPVAAGRLYHDGKTFRIGECGVLPAYRGQGFGDLLVKLLLRKAFGFGPGEVRVGAREPAVDFFGRYGFAGTGEAFTENGSARVMMSVTKDTLTFPSQCGRPGTFRDIFPVGGKE